MCESHIYTVQTWSNVSEHNPTISSHPKCVNQIFTQFKLRDSNVFGHNPTISSEQKCMNWLFTQFRLRGMCPDTIQQFLGSQNVRIGYLHSVDPE